MQTFIKYSADSENLEKTGDGCTLDLTIKVVDPGPLPGALSYAKQVANTKLSELKLFPERGLTEWFSPKVTGFYSQPKLNDFDSSNSHIFKTWRIFCSEAGKVILSMANKDNILRGRWLNDLEVSAGLVLLKKSFPRVEGLYDTIYCPRLVPEWFGKPFIQVFKVEGRWVCIKKPDGDKDEVILFDSAKDAIKRDLKNELKCIALTYKSITYKFAKVQVSRFI